MQPKDLMILADCYTGHVGIKLSTVGAYSANDGKFFRRLGEGYDCRTKTAQKVVRWFATNWPADLEWPRDIQRMYETQRRRYLPMPDYEVAGDAVMMRA